MHAAPVPSAPTLGPADAVWLGIDAPSTPATITAVLWWEGPVDHARVRDVVLRRLVGTYPAFRRRIVRRALPFLRPRWQDDPGFDLDDHVVSLTLPVPPPGEDTEQHLRDLVSRLLSERLDLTRSPWQLHVVDGHVRPGDPRPCSVLVARLHHSIADGIALAGVLLSLTDPVDPADPADPIDPADPTDPADPAGPRRPADATRPGGPPRANGGAGAGPSPRARLRSAATALRLATSAAGTAVRLLALPGEPAVSLRGPLGPDKHVAWTAARDLEPVRVTARALGGTVNDVLLAATAGALRATLVAGGTPAHTVPDLRVFVPVDLRRGRPVDPERLGNRFGLLPLRLPVAEPDALRRVRRTVAETRRAKASPEAAGTYVLLAVLSVLPRALLRLVVGVLGTKVTAVVTNVPGPRAPIELAGTGVEGLVFWVPQAAAMSVGLSIFTYAGTVRVGVAADRRLVPEPGALGAAVEAELDVLAELAGISTPRAARAARPPSTPS